MLIRKICVEAMRDLNDVKYYITSVAVKNVWVTFQGISRDTDT